MVSDKANKIGESPTFKVNAKAKAMKAQGIDIVDLSVGEPDFPTPQNAKDAGIKAIQENYTKYTQVPGTPELKDAIIQRLKEDHGLVYSRQEIIVSSGAKSSLYHLLQALINEGDEVIIPAPYWVTYPYTVSLAGGKSIFQPTEEENEFRITPEQLKAAITPATRAIIINNPSNPTGSAYSKQEQEALADIILEEDIYVIADEIYEKLVYDDFIFSSFASLGEEIKKKTIIINGVSKAYSMTGWRIGYAAGPADIIDAMSKIQGHSTSNPSSISQKASLEAFRGPQHEVAKMTAEFQRRRNYAFMRLQAIPEISCYKPQGAFYLFPNMSAYYKKEFNNTLIRNSYGLAYYFLKEAHVAIVPGDAFGTDNCIRLSYSTSMENLEKGMDRIIEALSRLKTAKKIKRISLNNTITHNTKSVSVDASVSTGMRDALVAEMENHLNFANYFEWNANINGVIVQLRTNVSHLNDFWIENWYPAQLESDLEPHGIIYAVDGITGREPRTFYSSETKTGILVNADNYAPLRSLALGLVMDVSESLFNVFAIRGMTVDIDGKGLVLIGPKGTKKTDLFWGLVQDKRFFLHSSDNSFIRFSGGTPLASVAERKFFVPTNSVEAFPHLASLFDSSKCENIIIRKEDCLNTECLRVDDCRLDRGSPFCYKASKKAHALLDPYWIEGPSKHVKRTALHWLFLLRNDPTSPPVLRMEPDEALRLIEAGESPGIRHSAGPASNIAYFNPHLLHSTEERRDHHRNFFKHLCSQLNCYIFNSGQGSVEDIKNIVADLTEVADQQGQ